MADTPPDGGEPNLLAGNISNTNLWNPEDKSTETEVRAMFDEMVGWAVEEGADLLIGTFYQGDADQSMRAAFRSTRAQMQGVPAQCHSQTMVKPGNAADAPLWAKPRRGRAFAPLGLRCSSLIGNEPTTLLAPCPRSAKDSVAAAEIDQRLPKPGKLTARWRPSKHQVYPAS